ncbi:MAG: type I secretion system permease/ATPase [Alphaproteobacteria bacterium]
MAEPAPASQNKSPTVSMPSPRDNLLDALVYLTSHYGHSRSAEALVAGLPVGPQGLTAKLFCDAAQRAGLRARVVRRSPSAVPAEVLPAVVMLKSRRAALILRQGETGFVRLLDVETGAEKSMPLQDLEKEATGYMIYVRPGTGSDDGQPLAQHWFWGSIMDSRGIYFRVLVAALLINFFALASPIFIMNFYNRVLPNNAFETGWVLFIGVSSIFVFDFIIKGLRGYFIDIAGRRADVTAGQRLFDQVLDMRLGARGASVGSFANNLREFDSLREFFNSATMTALVDFPFSLLFIAVIWLIGGPYVALLLLALYAVTALVGWALQLPVHRKVHQAMRTAEQRHGLLVETLASIETIRGVGGEGKLRASHALYTAKAAEAGQASRLYSGLSVHFSGFIQQLSGALIVIAGMYLVANKEMMPGTLIACVLLAGRAITPMGQVAALVNKYHHMKSAYRSLDLIMGLPVERPRDKKFLHRPLLRGDFTFKDVEFSYPRTARAVLQGINLRIAAGEKVAIVGRIGSGKSTLIKMLVNFYEPSRGTLLVDETDMRQIDPADLRRNVSYMGQDTALMSGTLRDNIVMGRPKATDAEVLAVADMAGVHDFARRHPMGYDAPVGERGEALSGGQRQAVALARTLLTGASTLILDEPTNAMDSGTEDRVLKGLEAYSRDKTLIVVTHKPSLLRLVTRLVVMDGGRIVADGPRDAVLADLANGKITVQQG